MNPSVSAVTVRVAAVIAALSPIAAGAAQASMDDYAKAVIVNAPASSPLIETTLPDDIYQTVTRDDLGDLRVFNAEGLPVPHALCAAAEASTPIITKRAFPVFELREAQRAQEGGSRIEIETPAGTHVGVLESGNTVPVNGRTHIIDVRGADEPLRAIQFDWESPDGASEARVRIAGSTDLDRWEVVVDASTLLTVTKDAQQLKRERIELPLRRYEYLRVERIDGGPPLTIKEATGERVAVAAEIEPLWFMPTALPATEAGALKFDTARIAPVQYARLRLSQENNSVRATLQSRPDDKSSWLDRWGGETYLIVSEAGRRESPAARFDATTDRYWRVRTPKSDHVERQLTLELGYRPARLRFLAQGAGPYTIAFGSRRVDAASATACDGLLADVTAHDRARLISQGYTGELRVLGGDAAFKPLPKKTPGRLIVLWSVLIVGVGVLLAMALTLLKRLRT